MTTFCRFNNQLTFCNVRYIHRLLKCVSFQKQIFDTFINTHIIYDMTAQCLDNINMRMLRTRNELGISGYICELKKLPVGFSHFIEAIMHAVKTLFSFSTSYVWDHRMPLRSVSQQVLYLLAKSISPWSNCFDVVKLFVCFPY